MANRVSQEQRKQQADIVHNGKYNYDLWPAVVSNSTRIDNICHIHGIFNQTLQAHVHNKQGCPKCVGRNRTLDDWLVCFNTIHDSQYTYTHVHTISKNTDIIDITCPVHGIFSQKALIHARGSGCPKCAGRHRSVDEWKHLAHEAHDGIYDYSNWPEAVHDKYEVPIVCKDHGVFHQKLNNHIRGKAKCPKCRRDWVDPVVIDKLSDCDWITNQHVVLKKPLIQIASELGVGDTMVGRYLHNHGLDTKLFMTSVGENELAAFVDSILPTTTITRNTRSVIPPLELDIYIPSLKIAIEYCGVFWHSEQNGKDRNYHSNKQKQCDSLGIQLLTIFEDEWKTRTDQVKQKIKSVLGVDDRPVVYARKTKVVIASKPEKQKFLNDNHIQGDGRSSINISLVHQNDIVACMAFHKGTNDSYVLNRYATSCRVVGGFSKLLKYFEINYKWRSIISFADLRWSTGNLYTTTGWILNSKIPPDYSYSQDGTHRIHKFNFRRQFLSKKLNNYDETLSERVNCDNNNVLRVWDCGKLRFIKNNN